MFYVYVLQSETDDGLYIGFSTDLRRRLKSIKRGNLLPRHIASLGV